MGVCFLMLVLGQFETFSGLHLDVRGTLCAVTGTAAVSCGLRAIAVSSERAVWSAMALGLGGYATGFVVLFFISAGDSAGPFGLNVSDSASLVLYPAGYMALLLLTKARVGTWHLANAVDGAVVALAVAAVAVSWTARTYPLLLVGSTHKIVYALAYAVGGATLLVATLTGLAMTRWRLTGTWSLLLAGFAVMTVGDAIYGAQSADGTFRFGTLLDAVYAAGPVLVSMAAWCGQPAEATQTAGNARVAMATPGVATLLALAVLVFGHGATVPDLGVWLAALAIVLAVARTAIFYRLEGHLGAESRREARTDELTGLPNRRALFAIIGRSLADQVPLALLLIDLDRFKEVNDTLGHAAGDRLLVEIADRLRSVGGRGVARLGGDEFAIVLDTTETDPLTHAAAVRDLMGAPVTLDGCRVAVDASIGIVIHAGASCGEDSPSPGELLRRADVALYRAKYGRTGAERWTPCLDIGSTTLLGRLDELRGALNNAEILVHYQPQVQPRTGAVQGMEALIRWQHPHCGLLGPAEFLPAAEQAGLMPALTQRVLDLVLSHQARSLRDGQPVIPVAINLSAPDLLNAHFAADVASQLAAHHATAACLRFEVTENVVMFDPERIMTTLTQLKALGVGLSLDDYGTGLSSLSYVRALPIDELKIDRSFVQPMTTDHASALIVTSTITLAHALGLRVVAEGVEDADTLRALADAGCDLVQGYYLGAPQAPDERPAPRHVPKHSQVPSAGAAYLTASS